ISAIKYAREQQIPFFGICLGMQLATVEYARHVVGLEGAHSAELDPNTPYPVIDLLPEQKDIEDLGGTLRLGLYPCTIQEGTLAEKIYGKTEVEERHRHRYEFNNEYREQLEAAGMIFSGTSPDGRLVEMVELKEHPFFIACQFHPEFLSRPNRPQPIFKSFIEAALLQQNKTK
ncbi:gamma-glutamyl-gamma-aminobutyrate hydrolase family protein, partial [Staphylococcus pseudintermedius]|nr:gamma-glutamyl-gamma-aminobutyrate hydrolase family protein [Staphylococcus pseudintermedius]